MTHPPATTPPPLQPRQRPARPHAAAWLMLAGTIALIGFLGFSAANRFLRAGRPVPLTLERAAAPASAAGADSVATDWHSFLGLTVREITPADIAIFGWPEQTRGVLVTAADPPRGIAPNDLIERAGETPVTSAESLAAALADADARRDHRLTFTVRRTFIGDYQHYYFAARAVLRGEDIYRQHVNCYGYLPMFAISQAPLVPLGFQYAGAAWALLCMVFTLGAVWIGAREIHRRLGFPTDLGALAPVMLLTSLVMADKIKSDFRLGQTDAPILLAFVLALAAVGRVPGFAGWCMGFIANFKYQSLAFLPYFLARARWSAAAWFILSSVALATAGSLLWGWETNQRFLRDTLGALFRMLGSREQLAVEEGVALYGLSWHRSVSVPSTLARLAEHMEWSSRVPVAGTALLAAGAFALGWWMYRRHGFNLFAGRTPRADDASPAGRGMIALEWAGLIVATLVFSPQSTARHFFLVLLPVMVALAVLIHGRISRGGRIALGVCVAAMWASLVLPPGMGDEVRNPFRVLGMPSWAALLMFFMSLWYGLAHLRAASRSAPAAPVPLPGA